MIANRTITSLFMVPTLGIPRGSLKRYGFQDAYSADSYLLEQYSNAVYVVFKPKNLDSFRAFLQEEYSRTSFLMDDYDFDGGFVVLVYSLNPVFEKDFDSIKLGKYSQVSEEFKRFFPKTVTIHDEFHGDEVESLQHKIFKKSSQLRLILEENIGITLPDDVEVWQAFDINKETLKL